MNKYYHVSLGPVESQAIPYWNYELRKADFNRMGFYAMRRAWK